MATVNFWRLFIGMRIISGKYKGRLIKIPKGIRPTQNKVRKALFDILGDITGLSFLELFAGSGAVGLEALSQGVKEVVFVENAPTSVKMLKENISSLLSNCLSRAFGSGCSLINLDAYIGIKRLKEEVKQFDIIFLDPPYYKDMAKKTLQTLGAYAILAPNGFVVVQHFKKDILPEKIDNLAIFKRTAYGDTVLSFYKIEQ